MDNREKAIRILEGNYKSFVLRHNGELLTVNELIALLKAQEPVEPSWRRGIPFCGKCGRQFGRGFKYCPDCGRAVKWK